MERPGDNLTRLFRVHRTSWNWQNPACRVTIKRDTLPPLLAQLKKMNTPHRITLAEVTAAPWLFSPHQWMIVHGVEQPHMGEISGVQMARFSKRGAAQYTKGRQEAWQASADCKEKWRQAVLKASAEGKWQFDDPGVSDEAQRQYWQEQVRLRRVEKDARFARLRNQNECASSDAVVGDICYNLVSYGRITKVNKTTVVMEGHGMKWHRRGLTWLSYRDLEALCERGAETITKADRKQSI